MCFYATEKQLLQFFESYSCLFSPRSPLDWTVSPLRNKKQTQDEVV